MQSQQLWKNECSHCLVVKKVSDASVGGKVGKMNAVTTIVEMNGLVRRGRWQEPRV